MSQFHHGFIRFFHMLSHLFRPHPLMESQEEVMSQEVRDRKARPEGFLE